MWRLRRACFLISAKKQRDLSSSFWWWTDCKHFDDSLSLYKLFFKQFQRVYFWSLVQMFNMGRLGLMTSSSMVWSKQNANRLLCNISYHQCKSIALTVVCSSRSYTQRSRTAGVSFWKSAAEYLYVNAGHWQPASLWKSWVWLQSRRDHVRRHRRTVRTYTLI